MRERTYRDVVRAPLPLLLAAIAACSDTPVQPAACEGISAMVSGAAADALDANGCLVLPPPTFAAHQILTELRARKIVAVYGPAFLPQLRSYVEAGHQGPINIADLKPCGPNYFAESPFVPPPVTVVSTYQNAAGPDWLIALCDEFGRAQVSVALAAGATYLTIQDGQVIWASSSPDVFGNEFHSVGAPSIWPGPLPAGPEQAVRLVYQATGRHVVAVPDLYLQDLTLAFPQAALWAVRLEAPVRVQGATTGAVRETDTLFVGLLAGFAGLPGQYGPVSLQVATSAQPTAAMWLVPPDYTAALDATNTTGWDSLYRRPDVPLRFEPAVVLK